MKGGFGFPFASIYSAWRRLGLAVAAGSPIAVAGPLCSWGAPERADPGFQHRVSSEARELSRVWGLGSPAGQGWSPRPVHCKAVFNHWTTRGSPERRVCFKLELCSGRVPLLPDLRTASHRLAALLAVPPPPPAASFPSALTHVLFAPIFRGKTPKPEVQSSFRPRPPC